MVLNNKKVLLVGLAKTGVSAIKTLDKLGANIVVNDIKTEEVLKPILDELKELKNVEYILGYHPENIDEIELVIVSPGVPLDLPFILKIKEKNIELIGEVELAYRLSNNPTFVGITGTNGKTTTTSLVGEIFKQSQKDTYIVGNIGNPVIDTIDTANSDSYLITELSSFQLESIEKFTPKVSAILNFTEDHLNRHHTMDEYIAAKANIFKNQKNDDYCILNYDDEEIQKISKNVKAKVIFFSRKAKLQEGIYLDENNNIVIGTNNNTILVVNKDELSLPGNHNLENCMAAIAISYILGIDIQVIRNVLKTFGGVEHRQEFVRNINNIMFVNDSKATNPDSSIKAVESYSKQIILIAGGMDKQNNFDNLLEVCKNNVKSFVLLGETAESISLSAKEKGFNDITIVANMKEAVETSYRNAKDGDVVLLSPACASWDMYKSFEVRGNDFKENVNNL